MPLLAIAGAALNSAAFVFAVMLNVIVCVPSSPSPMPVRKPATVCAAASSSTVCGPPTVNTGGSLTLLTVIVKVCGAEVSIPPLAVPPLSASTDCTVAVPNVPFVAVNVRVPVGETTGAALKVRLPVADSTVVVKLRVWADSSGGPAEIAVWKFVKVCGPALSSTDAEVPPVKLGASLTAVTLMTKVCGAEESIPPLAVPPLSCSTSVIVAVPFAFAAAV